MQPRLIERERARESASLPAEEPGKPPRRFAPLMPGTASSRYSSKRTESSALAFALCFPSVLTRAYFVALAENPSTIQQTVYAAGKIVQFTFPLLFLLLVAREPIRFGPEWRRGLGEGAFSGLLILASIMALWQLLLRVDSPLLDNLVSNVSAKIVTLGIETPWRYFALATFYSVIHTLLEEYYWRWFVFGRLRRRTGLTMAIVLSSFGFMAHHVIVMGVYAGWTSPYTYLFSMAVAVGGAYWAWLYERKGSIVAPWVSHFFVDVAIFAVGYALIS